MVAVRDDCALLHNHYSELWSITKINTSEHREFDRLGLSETCTLPVSQRRSIGGSDARGSVFPAR
jgi:hypothetical protein